MTTTPYTETLAEIRERIERNRGAAASHGDPVGVDIDCMTSGEQEAYHDGMAVAYSHCLALLKPGRVREENT